jgi:hypothetical protein
MLDAGASEQVQEEIAEPQPLVMSQDGMGKPVGGFQIRMCAGKIVSASQ